MDYILSIGPYILKGAILSVKVYAVTMVFAIPIGVLCAIGKIVVSKRHPNWFVRILKTIVAAILELYTWIFRGTPLLLQLFFVYYGLPFLNLPFGMTMEFDSTTAAYIAFALNYGAYFTEIFRAGIQAIDKGQYEAAKTLGMSYPKTMWSIVLPQAVKVILPPFGNEAVTLIKDTALCSAIALPEILRHAKSVSSRDFAVEAYIVAAVIYLVMTLVIIQVFKYLEKRFAYYD